MMNYFSTDLQVGYTPLCCAIKWEKKKVEQYLRYAGATEVSIAMYVFITYSITNQNECGIPVIT